MLFKYQGDSRAVNVSVAFGFPWGGYGDRSACCPVGRHFTEQLGLRR